MIVGGRAAGPRHRSFGWKERFQGPGGGQVAFLRSMKLRRLRRVPGARVICIGMHRAARWPKLTTWNDLQGVLMNVRSCHGRVPCESESAREVASVVFRSFSSLYFFFLFSLANGEYESTLWAANQRRACFVIFIGREDVIADARLGEDVPR